VDRRERERILAEGGVRESNPLERVDERRLAEELEGSPLRGRPLRRVLRNFRPDVENYVVSLGGPRPYMQRLREIERLVEQHERELATAWTKLRAECRDGRDFARRWRELAARRRFDEVNDLIDRHNRFFPIEARLPMDPRTGDFVRIGGGSYARQLLDAAWVLERFPADLSRAA
jgi:hypothetical protein